jgi:pimeloyl-ACP methyl ester carboxylesterase
MQKFFRKFLRAIVFGIGAIVVLIGGARFYVEYSTQRLLAIDAPNGINESMYLDIGGIRQWVQIRGQDRANPVLLWLNGGPGFSTIPATPRYRSWEHDFTVVIWDQRGEGKTFQDSGRSVAGTMTMERMAQDGIEVAEFLRAHLQKDKIVLLGHSWGSMLGLRMIAARPELFAAYVGTGQNVNLRRGVEYGYPRVLQIARERDVQSAIAQLEEVGPPPPRSLIGTLAAIPDLLFGDAYWEGVTFSQDTMLESMLDEDASAAAVRFEVPIFFFQGANDIVPPTPMARTYFDRIDAPRKEFIVLPDVGHLAIFAARDAFSNELVARVRPLAVVAS